MWDGVRVRAYRLERGWTRREMGRRLRVAARTVRSWERGERGVPGPVQVVLELWEVVEMQRALWDGVCDE